MVMIFEYQNYIRISLLYSNIYSNLFFKYFRIFKYQFEFRMEALDSFIHSENKAELLKKTTTYSASSDIASMHSNNSELFISKLMQEFNLELIDTEFNSQILYQAEKLFFEIYDIADSINVLVDKL